MKKIMALFLALCLFLPLGRPVSAARAEYPNADHVFLPGSGNVMVYGYKNQDAFLEALEVMDVPGNIVLPKSLQSIGDFDTIVELTDWYDEVDRQFWQYIYILRPHNEEGFLYLEVDHVNFFELGDRRTVLDMSYVTENMGQLDQLAEDTGYWAIIRDGIAFLYGGKDLTAISWQNGNISFSIELIYSHQFGKTDYAEGSLMNALLSLDEEKFAYARDILMSLGVEQDDNPGTGDDTAMWLVWMPLSLMGMVAVLGFKKRSV